MNDDSTAAGVEERSSEATKPSSPATSTYSDPTSNGSGRLPAEALPTSLGPPKTIWREYFESGVVTVIMALFGMTFVVQAVKVPTGSMQNTITIGDHLLVNKFIFGAGDSFPLFPQRAIRRGDIIVFKYPGNPEDPIGDSRPDNLPLKTNYVKRVIGVPGDHVVVSKDRVFINDEELPEHKITAGDHDDDPFTKESEQLKQMDVVTDPPRQPGESYNVFYSQKLLGPDVDTVVPEGNYFVMGDNRNNSQDSRIWNFVPREYVIGRAMFVYWSYDESKASSGNFLIDFFRNTRWNRTGTMVK